MKRDINSLGDLKTYILWKTFLKPAKHPINTINNYGYNQDLNEIDSLQNLWTFSS